MEQLPTSVRTLWRLGGALSGAFFGAIGGGGVAAAIVLNDLPGILLVVAVGVFVAFVAAWVWWADVRYRNWGWQITDRWVEAKHGVLARHRVVIPRNRVQTVTTNSGPVDRMLDLETVTVHTAGAGAPNLTIPHLTTATVARIRRSLGHGVDE